MCYRYWMAKQTEPAGATKPSPTDRGTPSYWSTMELRTKRVVRKSVGGKLGSGERTRPRRCSRDAKELPVGALKVVQSIMVEIPERILQLARTSPWVPVRLLDGAAEVSTCCRPTNHATQGARTIRRQEGASSRAQRQSQPLQLGNTCKHQVASAMLNAYR